MDFYRQRTSAIQSSEVMRPDISSCTATAAMHGWALNRAIAQIAGANDTRVQSRWTRRRQPPGRVGRRNPAMEREMSQNEPQRVQVTQEVIDIDGPVCLNCGFEMKLGQWVYGIPILEQGCIVDMNYFESYGCYLHYYSDGPDYGALAERHEEEMRSEFFTKYGQYLR